MSGRAAAPRAPVCAARCVRIGVFPRRRAALNVPSAHVTLEFRRQFESETGSRPGPMDKNKVIESASKLIIKGQFEKAVKEYQRVLEVDPDDVRVLQKLAELYQKMKKQSEAADCFEKVARTYGAQGFYLKAVALYKQVLKVVERVEVNVRLAELYQQLGLIGDATKEWQTVAAHHEKTGDHKASLDALKKLVDLDPDNVASRIRLGEQYARQENPVEAVAELRRAVPAAQRAHRRLPARRRAHQPPRPGGHEPGARAGRALPLAGRLEARALQAADLLQGQPARPEHAADAGQGVPGPRPDLEDRLGAEGAGQGARRLRPRRRGAPDVRAGGAAGPRRSRGEGGAPIG